MYPCMFGKSRSGFVLRWAHGGSSCLFLKAIEISLRKDQQVPRRVVYGSAVASLLYICKNLGRYKDAETLKLNILIILEVFRSFGTNHHVTSEVMGDVGFFYWEKGMLQDAVSYLERALEIICDTFEDLETFGYQRQHSRIYLDMGRAKEAVEVMERELELLPKVLGNEHAETLARIREMAIWFREIGREEKAVELESRRKDLEGAKVENIKGSNENINSD
jgi:tetratricopeptide (TPR) repeat protein